MELLTGCQLSFSYDGEDGEEALRDVSLTLKKGELAALLGANGCGKTTLVHLLSTLLPLQKGNLTVAGMSAEPGNHYEILRQCGMVFQNPENQFVSTELREDVAFAPENYRLPREEVDRRVEKALKSVGMEAFQNRAPESLSGGEKQKAALAGVLAMEPELLLFDEATTMLDPVGRQEMLLRMRELAAEGKAVLMVTHRTEEAVLADRVFLMKEGTVIAEGSPREVLTDLALLREAGVAAPVPVRLYHDLKKQGVLLPGCPLTGEELAEVLRCR